VSDTAEREARRPGDGPGSGYVPPTGVIAFSASAVGVSLLAFDSSGRSGPSRSEVGRTQPAGGQLVGLAPDDRVPIRFFPRSAALGRLEPADHKVPRRSCMANRELRWSCTPFPQLAAGRGRARRDPGRLERRRE
jgi:hypothetical protein